MFQILGKCHGHTIKKNIQLATHTDIQRVFSNYSQRLYSKQKESN